MENAKTSSGIKRLVLMSLFTAIIVVLQLVASAIKLGPFSITLVLAPIVVGAALCGPAAGAILGGVFGIVVMISGDAAAFMTINAVGTVITVMAKGILSGWAAGLIYRALEPKNGFLASIMSAVASPIVNTGVFLIGCAIFFMPTITAWGEAAGMNAFSYMIFGLVGLNFVVEFAVNVVLAGTITTLVRVGRKTLHISQ